MRILFKYFIWLLSFCFLGIYYLLGTALGHNTIGYLVQEDYSQKMNNKLQFLWLNIKKYPFIVAKIKVNDGAILFLNGTIESDKMNLTYRLKGDTFKWDSYAINHPINVVGTIEGERSEFLVKGEGDLFEGEVAYSFVKEPKQFKELNIRLNNANAEDLAEFLNYDVDVKGEVDVFMNFGHYSFFRKEGLAKISMQKARFPTMLKELELLVNAEVTYKDLLRGFFVDIESSIGKIRLEKGHYNKSANLVTANYDVHIDDLLYFKEFLGHPYQGALESNGSMVYESKNLSLVGESRSYGGLLSYVYKNSYLDLVLKEVWLEKLLRQLSFPALLSAKIDGIASYDIKNEIILINTKLKETRFRRTKMTDKIYDVTNIDILKGVYNNSIFTAGYEDNILTSYLQIDNGVNHLFLQNTRMNSKTNEITADFEVAIDGQEFIGDIYGTLENPKVNVDMSKLIKYQIYKKIDNFFH